jgi:O-antigen/teichoic acid export membrane protein
MTSEADPGREVDTKGTHARAAVVLTDKPVPAPDSIKRQFFWLASGRIVGALIQALTLGLVARWAGPAHFGPAAAVLGAAQATIAVADLGISPTLLSIRARNEQDSRVPSLLRLNARVSAVVLAGWLAGLVVAARATGNADYILLGGVAVWIAAEKNTETWLMMPLADGRTNEILRSLALRRALTAVVLIATYALGLPVLLAYSVALALSGLAGAIWTRQRLVYSVPPSCGASTMLLVKQATPFWLNSMAIQARNLDVIVVGLGSSPSTAGIYAVPSRLISPLSLLPSSLAQVVLPNAARGGKGSGRHLFRAVAGMTLGLVVCLGGMVLAAGELVPLMLGEQFDAAIRPLQILLVGLIFFGVTSSLVSVLQARRDVWFVAAVNLAILFSCLLGIYVGSRFAGALGAATALTVAYIFQAAILGWRAWRLRASLWGDEQAAKNDPVAVD